MNEKLHTRWPEPLSARVSDTMVVVWRRRHRVEWIMDGWRGAAGEGKDLYSPSKAPLLGLYDRFKGRRESL